MDKKWIYMPPMAEILKFRTEDILEGSPDDYLNDCFDPL